MASHFIIKGDGYMYCEKVSIKNIQAKLQSSEGITQERSGSLASADENDLGKRFISSNSYSPVFVYSKAQIIENVNAYMSALASTNIRNYILGYSMKANYNPHICKIFFNNKCGAVTVSGNEIQMALKLGVDGDRIVYNGNGKQLWEIGLAVSNGCMINVDSFIDLKYIVQITKDIKSKFQPTKILLRINPDIDTKVHPYLATGLSGSKFGIDESFLPEMLQIIRENPVVELVGLHCHLGSTIDNAKVFQECVDVMLKLVSEVRNKGFENMKYLNIGGGLGINYKHHFHRTSPDFQNIINKLENVLRLTESTSELNEINCVISRFKSDENFILDIETKEVLEKFLESYDGSISPKIDRLYASQMPTPSELIFSVQERLKESGLGLILEPGRSLIGNAGILSTKVIGIKENLSTNYIVVDGSMNEVIRPALYGAYHHIELSEPSLLPHENVNTQKAFDIVGPVCENADFQGENRLLQIPHEGCGLAIYDVGAYCSSMSSNYNFRMRPAEILVDKDHWSIIRKPDTMDQFLQSYNL